MTTRKFDYLKECMSGFGVVPHNEFKQAYCMRCLEQKCTWSMGSRSKFVERVTNWESNLFKNVNRASDLDPKYDNIRAKKFIGPQEQIGSVMIQNFETPQNNLHNDWGDEVPHPDETDRITDIEIETPMVELEHIQHTKQDISSQQSPQAIQNTNSPQAPQAPQALQNTNFQQGMMLDGSTVEKVVPVGGEFVFND